MPAPSGPAHPLLWLQRKAGNHAVARSLTRQRDATATAVVWTAPAAVSRSGGPLPCRTGPEVAAVLNGIAMRLSETGAALDETGEQELVRMAVQVSGEAQRYALAGALEATDPGYLTGYVALATALTQQQVSLAVGRALAALRLPDADPKALEAALDDLTERAHQTFIAGDKDALDQVVALLGAAKRLPDLMKGYAAKVQQVTDLLGEVRGMTQLGEMAKRVGALGKAIGEPIGKAKEIVEVVRSIANLGGLVGTPDGTAMMRGVNQFAAGIDLVDKVVGRFGAAVPVFGTLWNSIYKPMVDACVTGLRVIARADERRGRQFEIIDLMMSQSDGSLARDANGAPVLSRAAIAGGYFPGGPAVFSYIYAVRKGSRPALSDTVRDYFLDRADLFNVREEESQRLTAGEWRLLSPRSWFRSGRQHNVADWVARNVGKVWGMLYGDLGAYIS